MRTILWAAAVGAFSTQVVQPALGNVLTYSHTTLDRTAPFTDSFLLPAFDPSLGTLNSVEIILSTHLTVQVDVYNMTGSPLVFSNAIAAVPVTTSGPGGLVGTATPTVVIAAGTAAPGLNVFDGATATSVATAFIPTARFSEYENPPAGVSLSFSDAVASGSYSGVSRPGLLFGGNAFVGAVTTIDYTYTPASGAGPVPARPAFVVAVPEPASVALLGAGLAGMRLGRRRPDQPA